MCRISDSDSRKAALTRILIMNDKGRYHTLMVRPLKSFLPTADDVVNSDLPTLGAILLVYLEEYIAAASIAGDKDGPLWRTTGRLNRNTTSDDTAGCLHHDCGARTQGWNRDGHRKSQPARNRHDRLPQG